MQMLWLKRLQREVLGPVFETSIYVELLKRYAADQIGYWRTTDKKEIDFIVSLPAGPLPVEAKLSFPHGTPAAIRSFLESGGETVGSATNYRVVALYGKPTGEYHDLSLAVVHIPPAKSNICSLSPAFDFFTRLVYTAHRVDSAPCDQPTRLNHQRVNTTGATHG